MSPVIYSGLIVPFLTVLCALYRRRQVRLLAGFLETFSVGAHVHISPACDVDFYIPPPSHGNFCRSSLTPASLPLFYNVLHSIIQLESQSFTCRRSHVVCITQTLLPPLRLWSRRPPCEVVLFLVVYSSHFVPVLGGFTLCYTA